MAAPSVRRRDPAAPDATGAAGGPAAPSAASPGAPTTAADPRGPADGLDLTPAATPPRDAGTVPPDAGDPSLVAELGARRDAAQLRIADAGAPSAAKPAKSTGQRATDRASAEQTAAARAKLTEQGFTDIHLREGTVYYGQGNSRWAMHQYPKKGQEGREGQAGTDRPLRDAGCAPTALAMADATLRATTTTPVEVADYAVASGTSGKVGVHGSLTDALVGKWAADRGLTVTAAASVDDLRAGLAAGQVAIISVGKGNFTGGGHIMMLNGHAKDENGDEWYFVANPGKENVRQSHYDPAEVTVDPDLHHGAGRVRVSRDTLERELKYGFLLDGQAAATRP